MLSRWHFPIFAYKLDTTQSKALQVILWITSHRLTDYEVFIGKNYPE